MSENLVCALARISALQANFAALLAMVSMMFATSFSASVAGMSTQFQHLLIKLGVPAVQFNR